MNWYSKIIPILALATLFACKPRHFHWDEPSGKLLQIDTSFKEENQQAIRLILPFKLTLDSQMNKIVGHSQTALQKQRPEGLLGNWAADAVHWVADTNKLLKWHFTLLNHGGLRTDLPQGNITVGKIYEVMPFDNQLVLLGLTRREVLLLVDVVLSKRGDPISGLEILQSCENKITVHVNGTPLNEISDQDTIWLSTSDYMANGGDDYALLAKITSRKETGMLIRNALLAYLHKKPEIQASIQGRIQVCP